MRIRASSPSDAAALLALKHRLDRESQFMLLEPDERTSTAEEVARELQRLADSPNSILIVAERPGELIGYIELTGGRYRRNWTTGEVVIGVAAAASGRGIGTALLGQVDAWARGAGLHRLELTVMVQNGTARRLYERSGYVVEGRRRECLVVDGALVDELYMAKLLIDEAATSRTEPAEANPAPS